MLLVICFADHTLIFVFCALIYELIHSFLVFADLFTVSCIVSSSQLGFFRREDKTSWKKTDRKQRASAANDYQDEHELMEKKKAMDDD